MNYKIVFSFTLMWLFISGCDSSLPSEGQTDNFTVASGTATELTQEEYSQLSSTQKYQVATKLSSSIYKGIPVEDFYSLSGDLSNPTTTSLGANFITDFRASINQNLENSTLQAVLTAVLNPDEDERKYQFSANQPKEEPYALIYDYPTSRNAFIASIALFLSNTIMFSCAEEMESTNVNDCQKIYSNLINQIGKNMGVREIIRSYLPSIMNWRIGRSGQNVGVEGLEEFLGLFDRARDADKVGLACQDVILLPEDQNYELSSTSFPNTEPQIILLEDTNNDGINDSGGYFISRCEDFYNVITSHPLVMPRICEVIINFFMSASTEELKLSMCDSIVNSDAETFEDIFKGIIFSREYLLNAERVKGFDEFLLPTLSTLKWDVLADGGRADDRIWRRIASDTTDPLYMGMMGWHTMTSKIGRIWDVPTDPLSFVAYYNAARSEILQNTNSYAGRIRTIDSVPTSISGLFYTDTNDDLNLDIRPEIEALSAENFLHLLFLSVLQRPASSTELTTLLTDVDSSLVTGGHIINNSGARTIRDFRQDEVARIIYDYITRLPEAYYFNQI